jgi:hypothetical protein
MALIRFLSRLKLGAIAAAVMCLGTSTLSLAADLPARLFVRNPSGQIMETLTVTPGGGYVRRSSSGAWLGRAMLLGSSYRFVDQEGQTVATARPEMVPFGVAQRPLAQRPLAVVRDSHGDFAGTITDK